MLNDESLLTTNLQIDDVAHNHLKETAKWAKFMAIVGIILSCVLVLLALFAGTFLTTLRSSDDTPGISTGVVSIMYIFAAALYLFISLYLFRFGSKMQIALTHTDQDQFNAALSNHRVFYKILGIIMIIYLVIMALVIIIMAFVMGGKMM